MHSKDLYSIEVGNKYVRETLLESSKGRSHLEDYEFARSIIGKYSKKFRDENGNLPEDWETTLFMVYTERENGLGSKLAPCPFCKKKFRFYKSSLVNKNNKWVSEKYYMHSGVSDCILDELFMPFTIPAWDADISTCEIGEMARKYNEQLSSSSKMD